MTDSSKNEKIDSCFVNNGTPNSSYCTKKNRTICLLDGGECFNNGKCEKSNCDFWKLHDNERSMMESFDL